jgi:hypothetical protein
LSTNEAYVRDGLQFFATAIVVTLAVRAVLAVAAFWFSRWWWSSVLLWRVGWAMARLNIGGDTGPRLQARMARVFDSGKQKKTTDESARRKASSPRSEIQRRLSEVLEGGDVARRAESQVPKLPEPD